VLQFIVRYEVNVASCINIVLKWHLPISCNKCNNVGNTDCNLNSNTFPVVNEVTNLGVVVDTHLTFHSHIDKNVASGFIRSNLFLKCFVSHEIDTGLRALFFG